MNIQESNNAIVQFLAILTFLGTLIFWISPATAGMVKEGEPNNSIVTAQNIDGNFIAEFDPNIGDKESNTSMSMPHVTIVGTGDNTFDHYSFTVTKPGTKGIFDIDFGWTQGPGTVPVDTFLQLFDGNETLLASNDDAINISYGQGGSGFNLDSFLEFTFETPGVYVIQVGSCCAASVEQGSDYLLQVSLENPLVGFDPLTIRKAKIWFDDNPAKDRFRLKGLFRLHSLSNGIDPLTEEIRVQLGTFSLIIPPGSFAADLPRYTYKDRMDRTDVRMVLEEIGMDTYKFWVKAEGADLTNTTNPPEIRLQIGDDGGFVSDIRLKGKLRYHSDFDRDKKRKRNRKHGDHDD